MNILSINKEKREAVIKFDCSELVALCNAIFHETEAKEEKVNPIIWRLDYGITVASNLSQYGHIDSFALGRLNLAYEKINEKSEEETI